jgi:predicted RNA methylase
MLEIGSGNGLCSLTAAALGANATATEFNPLSLELISKSLPLQDEVWLPVTLTLVTLS